LLLLLLPFLDPLVLRSPDWPPSVRVDP
jgi:hypothetical protein